MRQFTDGAEATLLVTEGGHIPHTSGGSGAEGKKLRKFVPRCCRYAESYYPPHPFFKGYILWKQNTNCWLKELVIMEPTRLSNYFGEFLGIVVNTSSREKGFAIEVVHSGNLT